MNDTGVFRIPTKVVDLASRRRPIPEVRIPEAIGLTDEEITSFLKVCNKLRNLGERNVASIVINEDDLKVETRHYGEVNEEPAIVSGSVLCLSATMYFSNIFDVDKFRAIIEHVTMT